MADPHSTLLDIETVITRPNVAIDGIAYQMRALDDFSILEYKRHNRDVQRLAAFIGKDELTEAEVQEFKPLLDVFVRRVLASAPAAVHDKLTVVQRIGITNAFFRVQNSRSRAASTTAATETGKTPAATTGASTSPDSNASIPVHPH